MIHWIKNQIRLRRELREAEVALQVEEFFRWFRIMGLRFQDVAIWHKRLGIGIKELANIISGIQ
jgi:hypothetical protein